MITTGTTVRERELGVDLARGVALLSMFVAHTAPSNGPFDILLLSEFLTFPLFAILVGAGAALGARAHRAVPHLVRSLVAGGALLGVGWLVAEAGAHVVIVLGQLGVLTVLLWCVVRLPSLVVLALGLVAAWLAPWTLEASAETVTRLAVAGSTGWFWWAQQWVSHSYPQAVLFSLGCVGILGVRWALPRQGGRERSTALLAGVGTCLLLAAMVLLLAHRSGLVEVVPYRTAPLEQVLVAALASGVALWCLVLARTRGVLGRLGDAAARVVASAGAMTLTLYALHILWLAYWVIDLRPGEGDDTWVNVLGMSAVALVLGGAWRSMRFPRPWGRGPLEGVVTLVADLATMPWEGHRPEDRTT